MDADEQFREDGLRQFALEKAINTLTRQPVSHTPQDIVNVAEIFYQFLKGETK